MDSLERQHQSASSATEPTRSDPFSPGTTIARYRITSFIGSGAMGDVYRAHDRALDREVALKVLPPELTGDRERVRRFAQEARAASTLSHPHIVTIHEVGHARPTMSVRPIDDRSARRPEVHYIAMEFIEGRTLREVLNGSLPMRKAVELLAQVADGLGKAHAAGIVHRDLKPDNVLVATDGYAKIVDFGLAKLIDASWNPIGADSPTLRALTAHGELLGTPGYMAPEQVAGKGLDPRADIFSFGCMLYEAIARVRPFEAETFVDTLYKILHEEPPPLATLVPDIPPELQHVIERCLVKDRELRYQSIRDVAHDLRNATLGSARNSRPEAGGPAGWKPALLVALIAALPILGWVLLRKPAPEARPDHSVQRITSDGRASHVAISPDGRYVAYVISGAEGQTLTLEQIATGTTLAIVPAKPGAWFAGVAFARDGEQIYYTRYDNSSLGTLERISILGGTPRPIARDVDSRVAISRDGRLLAFVRDDWNHGVSQLMVANADGSALRVLAQFKLPDRIFSPAWSPDGTRILAAEQNSLVAVTFPKETTRRIESSTRFAGFRGIVWPEEDRVIAAATIDDGGSRYRVWDIDPSNGRATALTDDLTEVFSPAISDDGAIVALQAIRQANLFDVDASGNVKQLTTGVGAANGVTGVAWIDGRVAYSSSAQGKPDLWITGNGDARQLTDDDAVEALPVAAPDGSALFYLSGSGKNYRVFTMKPDGSDRKPLTRGPRDGEFAISPDSKTIAFASLDTRTNQWGLWTMPASGGAARRIAVSPSVLEQIHFTPDGKTILFTGYEQSALHAYRIAASGGRVEPIAEGRAHTASMSPDGSMLAYASGGTELMSTHLTLAHSNGAPPAKIAMQGMLYRWTPDSTAVSFIREENGRADLWLQPRNGSAAKRLTNFTDGRIAAFAWSPDAKHAVVAHVSDAVDVVVIR